MSTFGRGSIIFQAFEFASKRRLRFEQPFRKCRGSQHTTPILSLSYLIISGSASEACEDGEEGVSLEAAGVSSKEIKNIFTELRKGANHPLMLLNYFKGGGKTTEVVDVLLRAEYFGAQATREMVSAHEGAMASLLVCSFPSIFLILSDVCHVFFSIGLVLN